MGRLKDTVPPTKCCGAEPIPEVWNTALDKRWAEKDEFDPVNHPFHYNVGKIDVISFIEDQKLNYHIGNVLKYICRAPHKGEELQDLKKAAWYLARRIELLESAK